MWERRFIMAIATTLILWPGSLISWAQAQKKDQLQVGTIAGKPAVTVPGVFAANAPAPANPSQLLRTARTICVRSESLLVGQSVVEEKLRKRREFREMGLMITRDEMSADLILELRHDLFTMYVYTAIDPSTKVVVASGKLSSLGGTVAGKVAERFMKQMVRARELMQVGG